MGTMVTADPMAPQVPGYRLLHKLGQGGMGEVYLARAEGSTEAVAIKLLLPGDRSGEAEARARFEREARLLGQLAHPNIIRVMDHGLAEGRPFLVMEHMAGGSLRVAMTPGQPWPVGRIRTLLGEVATALAVLEAHQIVHRDLKPENVLLGTQGQVKLTDFGISAALTEVGLLTNTAQALGTLDYMAPEQRARLPVDTRADQFSLAVMAYELLTGKRPVGHFKPPSRINGHLHPTVDAVLARALQEDADDRFPGVAPFAAALDQALQRRPRSRARRVAFAVALLAAGGLLAALAASGGPASEGASDQEEGSPVATPSRPDARATRPPAPPTNPAALRQAADALYYLDQGDRHLSAGRLRDAELCYTEVIRLLPNDPRGYLRRARVFKQGAVFQKALDDLRAVLRLDATLIEAWTGIGSIYVQLKDYAHAVPELDQALARNPKAAEALAWRGWARYKLGQKSPALKDLDAAIAADRACGVAFQFRALVHNAAKHYRQGRADLEAAVRCLPESPHLHCSLADFLALCPDHALRDPARAVRHARTACELTQWKDWTSLRFLAKASASAGDLKAAIRWAEQALELAPDLQRRMVQTQLAGYRKRLAAKQSSP